MGLRSGIRDPEELIPDPGSKGQTGTGSWIRKKMLPGQISGLVFKAHFTIANAAQTPVKHSN